MKEKEDASLIDVFTGSLWQAELVKGLLENNGIRSVTKDGIMSVVAPYLSDSVAVMVTKEDYEAAMEVIRSRKEFRDE